MRSMQAWGVVATLALAFVCAPPAAQASSLYEDMLMQDLMKRLYAEDDYPVSEDWYDDNGIPLENRDNGEANIRDQEYLQHTQSQQGGFQYIQGMLDFTCYLLSWKLIISQRLLWN